MQKNNYEIHIIQLVGEKRSKELCPRCYGTCLLSFETFRIFQDPTQK